MTEENQRLNARLEWMESQEAWQDVEALVAARRWKAAISRMYYSLYHAARALLFCQGLEPKTHEGVHRLLSQRYVLPGTLPSRLARVFSRLQKYREEADYAAGVPFSEEDVLRESEAARDFLRQASRLLQERGCLP